MSPCYHLPSPTLSGVLRGRSEAACSAAALVSREAVTRLPFPGVSGACSPHHRDSAASIVRALPAASQRSRAPESRQTRTCDGLRQAPAAATVQAAAPCCTRSAAASVCIAGAEQGTDAGGGGRRGFTGRGSIARAARLRNSPKLSVPIVPCSVEMQAGADEEDGSLRRRRSPRLWDPRSRPAQQPARAISLSVLSLQRQRSTRLHWRG